LGSYLRGRREDLGLFQQELAMLAGVSARYIHMLEGGKSSVRLDTFAQVLDTLGLCLTLEQRPEPTAVTLR
jgi:y4mF family transcriptional regulator